jgi:hypothetical protein
MTAASSPPDPLRQPRELPARHVTGPYVLGVYGCWACDLRQGVALTAAEYNILVRTDQVRLTRTCMQCQQRNQLRASLEPLGDSLNARRYLVHHEDTGRQTVWLGAVRAAQPPLQREGG